MGIVLCVCGSKLCANGLLTQHPLGGLCYEGMAHDSTYMHHIELACILHGGYCRTYLRSGASRFGGTWLLQAQECRLWCVSVISPALILEQNIFKTRNGCLHVVLPEHEADLFHMYQEAPQLIFPLHKLHPTRNAEIGGSIVDYFKLEPALKLPEQIGARNESRNGGRGQQLGLRYA